MLGNCYHLHKHEFQNNYINLRKKLLLLSNQYNRFAQNIPFHAPAKKHVRRIIIPQTNFITAVVVYVHLAEHYPMHSSNIKHNNQTIIRNRTGSQHTNYIHSCGSGECRWNWFHVARRWIRRGMFDDITTGGHKSMTRMGQIMRNVNWCWLMDNGRMQNMFFAFGMRCDIVLICMVSQWFRGTLSAVRTQYII